MFGAISASSLLLNSSLSAEKFKVWFPEYPPHGYLEDNVAKCYGIELATKVLDNAGIDHFAPEQMPWPRAYAAAQNEKNVILCFVFRTPERENLFNWIGPMGEVYAEFLTTKTVNARDKISISSLEDAKKYTIGILRDEASHQFLQGKGGYKMESVPDYLTSLKKLASGRIQLVYMPWSVAAYTINQAKKSDWKKHEELNSTELMSAYKPTSEERAPEVMYMVYNVAVDKSIAEKCQKALDAMKANGEYQKIIDSAKL